ELLSQVNVDSQPGGPGEGPRDPDIKVRTVLDRAAKTIGAQFANQPRVEAAIRMTIAHVYDSLGNRSEARLHGERALELRSAHLGADHADTLTSKNFLAQALHEQGEVKRAEALMLEVLERRTATLGPDHPDTLRSKDILAEAYLGRFPLEPDRAEVLLQEVVQKRTARLGPNDQSVLISKINLAWAYRLQEKLDRAEALYLEL